MIPNTQFKINSEDDIIKHYKKYRKKFLYSLFVLIEFFADKKYYTELYIIYDSNGVISINVKDEGKEVVPNPYTNKELDPNSIDDLMQKLKNKANELGFEVDISFKPKNK